jgi:hypothetical protein
MNRVHEWTLAFAALGVLWYECRQDLAIFCYRIGCHVLAVAHRQAVQLVPASKTYGRKLLRTSAACSIPSFTSSAPYMTPRDSKS